MAGDFVLAIDQGTTSSRAIVFNHDSATVGEAQDRVVMARDALLI